MRYVRMDYRALTQRNTGSTDPPVETGCIVFRPSILNM